MEQKKLTAALMLSLIGSILILANGIWIITNGGPIILSSFPIQNRDDALNARQFWARISFGHAPLSRGIGVAFWLIFAVAMLLSVVAIYFKPRRQRGLGVPIIIFSVLSIPIGGGFILGAILGMIGGAAAAEWPKQLKDTFVGKILAAARMSSSLFGKIADEPTALKTAAFVIIVVGILSGLGNSLYTYNREAIHAEAAAQGNTILAEGAVLWDNYSILNAAGFIGIEIMKWIILSLALYIVGVKFTGYESSFDKLARTVAFARIPIALNILLPIMFSNEPTLSYTWPMLIYVVSNIWAVLAMIVAIKETFAISISKAIGNLALGGSIYWTGYNLVFAEALALPGFRIDFTPESSAAILTLITIAVLIATLLGVFERR